MNHHLPAGTYYIQGPWNSNTNSWQNPYTLTVNFSEGIAPPIPTLLSPTNGATNVSQSLTLDWQNIPSATSYKLQVSTDISFTNLIINATNISYSDYLLEGLNLNTNYYWRVSSTNYWGTSGWSRPIFFHNKDPNQIQFRLVVV